MDTAQRIASLEDKLEASEQALKSMERAAGIGRWAIDLISGDFVCSHEFRRIYDLGSVQKFKLDDWYSAVHEDDRGAFKKKFEKSLYTSLLQSHEHRIKLRAGRTRSVRQEWRVESQNGQPAAIKGFCLDLTGRYGSMQSSEFWRHHKEGLLLVSEEGVIDAVNPAAEGIFLYSEDELLGRRIERLIPELYQNHRTLREELRFDAAQQPIQDRILKGLRADGSEIDISISLVPLDATAQIVASITDMTDQSELLDNIAQQDERFTELVNALPLAVIQLDEMGQTVFVNKYADRLNVDFSDFAQVVYLEGTDLQVERLSELVFDDHYLDGIELSSRSTDRIPVEVWLLKNNAGTIIVCNEVRIRRDLEEARSAGEEGFKRVLNRLPISMLLLDPSADLEFANLHAVQAGLVQGAGNSDVGQLPVCMNPGSMVPCSIAKFVHDSFEAAGSGVMVELDFILADGTRLPMNCWLTPFKHDERGAVTQILAILIDRTDQMLKEEADTLKLEAEASSRAKSRFLTNISHELRTPLNAVLGFQQLIGQSGQLTGDQKDNLEMANQNGVELLQVINDILELSRIESADLKINPEEFSLADLLSEVERAFTPKQSISDVKLVTKVDGALPDRLFADYDKLRQIIFVLMDNAFKFTKKGEVSIEFEKRNSNGLLIRVKDTGRGIDEKLTGSLFEPFQHLDYQAEHGLGLGLSICQSYARAMGGEVEVRSQLGSGAEFEVLLPLLGDETVNSNVPVLHRESGSNMPRVLVVDDSFPAREILRQLLTAEGITYEEAGNGLEALERVREFRPDVILMDLEMPVMDGFEATRRIKQEMDVKILAISARVYDADVKKAYDAGIDGFIGKPYRLSTILNEINSAVNTD